MAGVVVDFDRDPETPWDTSGVNPSHATTIVNARVFDGARLQDWTSVRFADGIVTNCATGSTAQDGDEVIDADGGTILPGLIDSHVHLVPGALSQALIFGATTVLEQARRGGPGRRPV